MDTKLFLQASPVVQQYLGYLETVKNQSPRTVEAYFIDLRTFFRFIKQKRKVVPAEMPLDEILVDDVNLELIRSITLTEVYQFMNYVGASRSNQSATRSRKVSALRNFFEYLTNKMHLLETNPVAYLETPKQKRPLPKYLSLEQSVQLLESVDGPFYERDYCMLTLFLNCGMRLGELVGINISDIRQPSEEDPFHLRIVGKGNKERIIYLNQACLSAIEAYLKVRPTATAEDRLALFLSNQKKRISPKTVQFLVKKYLKKAGLDGMGFSTHKLRHTAATLMYQSGDVDVRVLKDLLGHENLNTTQIYTHLSNQQLADAVFHNPLSQVDNKKEK